MKLITMFKRTLLIAALSGIVMSVTAQAKNAGETFDDKITRFNALNITDIKPGTVDREASVSRSDFADIAARIINPDFTGIDSAPEGDITADNQGILFLRSMGIVSGDDAGNFEPNRNIKPAEAMKILVCIGGYTVEAENGGGTLESYYNTAVKMGLLKGVNIKLADEISYENVIDIIDNFLDTDVMQLDNKTYTTSHKVTVLEQYRGMYRSRGIVQAYGDTSLLSNQPQGFNSVRIGNDVLNNGGIDCTEFVGMNTEFYYSDDGGEYTLKYIFPYRNNILTINHRDIDKYENGRYTYTVDNIKEKHIDLPKDIIFIYNGVRTDELPAYIPQLGSLTFIDNDSDGEYEVLSEINKDTVIVSAVVDDKLRVVDKFNSNYSIELDGGSFKSYEIYKSTGETATLRDITANNVIEVVKGAGDNPPVKVFITDSSIDGVIETIYASGDNRATVKISGTEYPISARLSALLSDGEMINEFSVGMAVTAHLNSYGEVVWVESGEDDGYRVGYVIGTYRDDTGEDIFIKLVDQGGTVERLGFAKSVKMDSGSVKNNKITEGMINVNQLVKYKTDIAGAVTEMYYPNIASEKFKTICEGSFFYRSLLYGPVLAEAKSGYVSTHPLSSSAKVFVIPSDTSNTEYYKVVAPSDINSWDTYNVYGCNTGGDFGKVDAMVLYSTSRYGYSGSGTYDVMFVNKIVEEVCSDGDIRYVVKGLVNGSEKSVEIDDIRTEADDIPIKCGNVIYYKVDTDGRLQLSGPDSTGKYSYELLVSVDDGTVAVGSASGKRFSRSQTDQDAIAGFGPVYDTQDSSIFVNVSGDVTNEADIAMTDTTNSNIRVYIWDKQKKKFRIGTLDEAIGYKSDPIHYMKAYTFVNYSYGFVVLFPTE